MNTYLNCFLNSSDGMFQHFQVIKCLSQQAKVQNEASIAMVNIPFDARAICVACDLGGAWGFRSLQHGNRQMELCVCVYEHEILDNIFVRFVTSAAILVAKLLLCFRHMWSHSWVSDIKPHTHTHIYIYSR